MESIMLTITLCIVSVMVFSFFNLKRFENTVTETFFKRSGNKLTREREQDLILTKAAMVLISEHYCDPQFNTEKLALMLNSSPRSLQRKFKATYQSSPSKEIKKSRLKHSVTGLNANLQIKRVGFESGFSSASYFCKCFKEYYGCTPSEYLVKNNKNPPKSTTLI